MCIGTSRRDIAARRSCGQDRPMIGAHPLRLVVNPRHGVPGLVVLPEGGYRRAKAAITAWPGYAPTPLLALDDLAASCGLGALHYKDEATRFGLGSFKALGGAYAVARVISAETARRGVGAEALTVTCATDGNHGRSVAWGAQRVGCRCVIFVHETVSQGRRDAIARYGAEIREVPGNYDDAVRASQRVAEEEGWLLVSDTSWPGYTEVPRDVMQGYRLMAEEAIAALPAPPTHVFVQGGVGGMAAAVAVQLRAMCGTAPRLVIAEPERAACLTESLAAGEMRRIAGELDTLMAGLACGEPSLLAWSELERSAFAAIAIPDAAAIEAMRLLASRVPRIVAGESAVAGLVACLLACRDPASSAALGLGAASRVLVFGSEGATDPELYTSLTGIALVDGGG
jgi:diaminopropionate ammonia-lyase